MTNNEFVPFGKMYRRRIHALLEQGVMSRLMIIEAAPGYWKSELTEDFLRRQEIPHAWLRLRGMDNWAFYFWEHFIGACAQLYPGLSGELTKFVFPETPRQIGDFLKFLDERARPQWKAAFIIDNYSILHNEKILAFIQHLIESELSDTCLVIINNLNTGLETAFIQDNIRPHYIGEETLQMLPEEVQDLFEMHGIELSLEAAGEMAEQWDGWPMAIGLLAYEQSGEYVAASPTSHIHIFFDREYFSKYSEGAQKLLVQLSLVEFFDLEMVRALSAAPKAFEDLLRRSPFVYFNPRDNTFAFRHAYQAFLASHQDRLEEDDRFDTYLAMADMLQKKREHAEAIPFLLLCRAYDEAVENIWLLTDVYAAYTKVRFLAHSMEQLPAAYLHKSPRAELLQLILLLEGEVDGVEAGLEEMRLRFDRGELTDTELLGEVHFLQAHISQIRGREDFATHYRLACEYLPHGSRYWREHPPILLNTSLLILPDNKPGALARIEKLYEGTVPDIKILLRGSNAGLDVLVYMEARYYTYELDKAYVSALEIAYTAELNGQHEMVLIARYTLARIAILKGDVDQAEKASGFMNHYIERHKLHKLAGVCERLAAILYLYTGIEENVPVWLLEDTVQERSLWEVSRSGLLRAFYLYQAGKSLEAVALLNQLEALNRTGGSWINAVYRQLIRAMAYHRLNDADRALNDLHSVYDMTHANGVITPFIECGSGMRTLLDLAAARRPGAFDEKWLKNVRAKASNLGKKVIGIRKTAVKSTPASLSPRRLEVLRGLAHGYTTDEIAEQMGIATSTVKTHVTAIYNALGAVNRADAIRIATGAGLI